MSPFQTHLRTARRGWRRPVPVASMYDRVTARATAPIVATPAPKPARRRQYTAPSTSLRTMFVDLANRAEYNGRRTAITRHGKPVAAIVSIADLEFLNKNRPVD
jgi:prevent-host-death family protein